MGRLSGLTGSAVGHRSSIAAGLCQKSVSSFTLPHYLWRSLGPFSLRCAQKLP